MRTEEVDLTISNARVVTPTGCLDGGVAVDDGRIVEVGLDDRLPAGDEQIDADGNVVLPGAIDPHTHMGLAGYRGDFREHFERDFSLETRGAVHAGVTTMLTFLFQSEPYAPNVAEYRRIGEANSYIDFGFHAVVQHDHHLDEIPTLAEEGISSFKLFFNMYKTAAPVLDIQHADAGQLYEALSRTREIDDGLVMVHAENDDVSSRKRKEVEAEGRNDLKAWADASPPVSETMQVDQIARLARDTQGRAYVVHVSAAESVDVIDKYRSNGVPIHGETLAAFLAHNTEQDIGVFGKVSPPIRGPRHQRRLWEGVSSGTLTHVGTDHAPSSLAGDVDRDAIDPHGDIWDSPRVGRPGMGYLLPVLLSEGVNTGRISLEEVAAISATNSAKLFGLYPQKGAIVEGGDADLVIADLDATTTVDDDFYRTMEPRWSSLHGREIQGLPTHTIVGGELAVEDGELLIEPGTGEYLER
jgi:dihydropyrimidinase